MLAAEDQREDRMAAIRQGIRRNDRQATLQRLVEKVSRQFNAPMAAISIIDSRWQRLAAAVGLDFAETPREQSFCIHALHRPGELLVVPDATRDRRFAGNPFVIGSPGIRFYAGKPLITRDGFAMGALCIMDDRPRPQSPDLSELTMLAFEAERLING